MRSRWLQKARANLDEATAWVARTDADAAQAMYAHVRARINALATHPERGRPGRIFGTRELVIERYGFLVPYTVHENEVHILRLFHCRQRPPENW